MAGQWSREDLLRAFDLLTRTEQEVRVSDQPRYNLEMGLLRLMHLRKLVPLGELLRAARARRGPPPCRGPRVRHRARCRWRVPCPSRRGARRRPRHAGGATPGHLHARPLPRHPRLLRHAQSTAPAHRGTPRPAGGFNDAFLAEIKAGKSTFYNLVVASAYPHRRGRRRASPSRSSRTRRTPKSAVRGSEGVAADHCREGGRPSGCR